MKRVSLFFAGLFLSMFLFAVLPMVSADHAVCNSYKDEKSCNSLGMGSFVCKDGPFGVYSKIGAHQCFWTGIFFKDCTDVYLFRLCTDAYESKCVGDFQVDHPTGRCKNGNECELVTDLCLNGCENGECKSIFSLPSDVDKTDSDLPNTNPFLFKTLLLIFVVVLAFVIYFYLKPKKNKNEKR